MHDAVIGGDKDFTPAIEIDVRDRFLSVRPREVD
jgi:hypothetical protein